MGIWIKHGFKMTLNNQLLKPADHCCLHDVDLCSSLFCFDTLSVLLLWNTFSMYSGFISQFWFQMIQKLLISAQREVQDRNQTKQETTVWHIGYINSVLSYGAGREPKLVLYVVHTCYICRVNKAGVNWGISKKQYISNSIAGS